MPTKPKPAPAPQPPTKPEIEPDQPARDLQQNLDRAAWWQRHLKLFDEVHNCHLDLLAAAAKALSRDTGCGTPAEQFVTSVLMRYRYADEKGRGMTPADVEDGLQTFREDFEDMIQTCAFNGARYPELIEASEAAA